MSFRDEVPAEELAEFLRSNEGGREKLVLSGESYSEWSESELDAVVDAAKQNTSVRTLSIDVEDHLHTNIVNAEVMSSFIRHLRGLQSVNNRIWFHEDVRWKPRIVEANDILLRGIMKSQANIKNLSLQARVSPGLFLKFAERFPNLESLALVGPCESDSCYRQCSDYHNFATEVAIAVSRFLRSLRRVSLAFCGKTSPLTDLLSYLGGGAPTTLTELEIVVDDDSWCDSDRISESVARFCALTKTLEKLKVRYDPEPFEDPPHVHILCVGPMFRFWCRHPLSDSIREMHFEYCELCDSDVPVEALKNLEVLRLKSSIFRPALSLLNNLPRLRSIHFTLEEARKDYFRCRRGILEDNSKLEALCETVERRDSMLQDIEIDLFGGNNDYNVQEVINYPFERFAASERLLRACRGRLVVNFASLPIYSCFDIVDGLESLRGDLKELRLRFRDCQFTDTHYGRILEAVRQNKTLAVFEFGLLGHSTRFTDKMISSTGDLVATNRTLDTLSLLGIGYDEAVPLLDRVLPILASTPNMTLRSLQLDGVDLTDAWPRLQLPLLSMLRENPVLSHLDGVVIPWNDPAYVEVRHLLKLNRYGRRFLPPHETPRPTEGLWATILARITKDNAHEVMYPFLRAKPSLLESRKRKHF